MDWDKVYRDLRKRNWIILFVMATISYFLMNPSLTMGIILGGFIIIANFRVFQNTIRSAFSSDGVMHTTKLVIIVKYYFRLLALGIIIFLLITQGWVDPIGLAVGLSTVVISIVSFGINRVYRMYIREAT